MNSLNRFIRKNQKKFLAFFSAALMVVFIITLAPSGWRKAAQVRDQTIGVLAGKDVTRNQLMNARNELQLLSQLEFTVPNDPQMQRSIMEFLYGNSAQNIANANGMTFFLLLEEAKRQGISVDQEEIQTLLKNNISGSDRALADADLLQQALTDGMAVRDLLDQAANVIKISKPLREWELSRADQNLVVSTANFPASRFKDQVPAIKDSDITTQFDSFKDSLPGQYGSTGNPLGFGYKIPNRVQVQYIGIRGDDAKAAAKASKNEQDWYIAAYHAFEANRQDYDQRPVVITVPAATQPSAAATTQPTTRMAVQKLDDDQADWALHSSIVLDDLYQQEARKLEIASARKISDTLASGFSQWREAQSAAGAAAATNPSSPFISESYLLNLAQSIKTQFGVMPVYGTTGDFKTADQLKDVEGIGKTMYLGSNYQTEDFSNYAVNVKDFLSDTDKQSAAGRAALSLFQPSNMMLDTGSNLYYFRVSAIDPAHASTLDACKDRVIADWKLAAAYNLALKTARGVLDDAKNRGLVVAAGAANASVIVTQPFNPQEITNDTMGTAKIIPLNLQSDSLHRFAAASQNLLTTPPSPEGHPLSLAELYADATASVIELNSAKPLWDVQMQGPLESEVVRSAISQQRDELLADYTRYDAVAKRLDYKPAANVRVTD